MTESAGRTFVTTLHFVTPPIWRCIYCGDTAGLSREHAIPYALFGRIVLPRSSCEACRRLTHAFETDCIDNLFGAPLRYRMGIPSRKGHVRKAAHRTTFEKADGERVVLSLPTEHVPQTLSIPMLTLPKIISGNPHDDLGIVWNRVDTREFNSIEGRFGAVGITKTFSILAFLQMLAKIGHCLAHAILQKEDLATFRMLVPDRLRRADVSELLEIVGGAGVPPDKTDVMHDVEAYTLAQANCQLLCVKVRLFAFMGAPEHIVVVGQRAPGFPDPIS